MPRWSTFGLVLAVVLSVAPAPAADAARATRFIAPADEDQWVMTTGGYSAHPCREIVVEPNVTQVPAEHRPAARAQVAKVVEIYNGIIGRPVFQLGADTTRGSRTRDGHHVFELTVHGDPDAGTEVARYASGHARVIATGTVDGGRHVTELGGEMDLELNPTGFNTSIDTFVHEFGHGLGFHHTIDARSIMSYSQTRRHYYDSLDDQRRWGTSWVKGIRELFPADCAYVTLGLRHDWRKGGPEKGTAWFSDREIAALEDGVDTVVGVGLDLVDGPNIEPWKVPPTYVLERLVVCRDDVFADCLGGSALAGTVGAVAFVPGGPDGVLDESDAWNLLRTSNAETELIILGGPAAVSEAIEQQLREKVDQGRGGSVTRIKGEVGTGRYGTAAAIADRMLADGDSDGDFVLLARADNPVDAVAAGAIAARDGLPILLTEPGQLTSTTRDWLAARAPARVAVLGGRAAVSDAAAAAADQVAGQVERVSGANRRATSVAVARHPWLWQRHEVTDSSRFWFVNGEHEDAWALALAAAPWAARGDGAILLSNPDTLGFAEDGADGRDPDPGWYLWSLRAPTEPLDGSQKTGWWVMGTSEGAYTHPIVGSSARLTANAKATYAFDG